MPRVAAGRHMSLDPLTVWRFMSNADRRPDWDLSVRKFRRDGAEGDMRTRLHYIAPLLGRVCWMWEGRYVVYDPPRRSAVQMVRGSRLSPVSRLAGTWVVHAEGDGSYVEMIVQFESRLPLVAAFLSRRIKQVLERSLVQLDMAMALEGMMNGRGADGSG